MTKQYDHERGVQDPNTFLFFIRRVAARRLAAHVDKHRIISEGLFLIKSFV